MKYIKLKEIITPRSERNKVDKGLPVYSVTNSNGFCRPDEYFNKTIHSDELSKYKVCKLGDIAYNPVNLKIGSINSNDKCDCIVSPLYEIFTIDNKIMLNDYLIYFLTSRIGLEKIRAASQGSVRVQCKLDNLSNIVTPCPSIDVQVETIAVLNNLTNSIKQISNQLELVDSMIESKYAELFIKESYPKQSISDIGTFKNGMTFAYKDDGMKVKCLGVGDFKNKYQISNVNEELDFVSLSAEPSKDDYLNDGDIVFVRSNGNKNLVGRSIIVYTNGVPTVYSGFCIRFRNECPNFLNEYLLFFFRNKETRKLMAGRGSNIQNLNQKILSKLMIPCAPIEKQIEFVNFLKEATNLKEELEKKKNCFIELLSKQKDTYFN